MKTLNLAIALLFCVFFVNISTAQTVKQQQTNKKDSIKGIKLISNVKNDNLLKVEKDSTLNHKNIDKAKQKIIISKTSENPSKINIIRATTVLPNKDQIEKKDSNQEKGYKYKLNYQQQIKNKEVQDE